MYLLIIRFQISLSASCGLKRFIVFLIPNYNHLPTPNFLVTLQRQVGGTASRCARMCGETLCENVQRDAAPPILQWKLISDGQPSVNGNDYGKKRL